MIFNQEFADKFKNGVLLRHCGEKVNLEYDFDVQFEENIDEAMENIASLKWEAKCLDNQNKIVEYLCVNYPNGYIKIWNNIVNTIKETVMVDIQKELEGFLIAGRITEEAYDMLVYNVILSIVAYSYSSFYESDFYKNISEVLLSGHIPCGWNGTRASGEIIVH